MTGIGAWRRIDDIRRSMMLSESDPPPGAFTLQEYSERYKLPQSTARHQLRAMVRSGMVETGMFRIRRADGKFARVRHFWLNPDFVRNHRKMRGGGYGALDGD